MPPSPEIRSLVEIAQAAAQAGGQTLLDWRGRFSAREKGPADFVTDADLASQEAVQAVIARHRPDDPFVGEEQAGDPQPPPEDQLCWVVDPLDGTTNYLHGFPFFAVSVAVTLGGEPIAGVVFNPLSGEEFWAGKGLGAWLGEERIATSSSQRLEDSLVAMSLPAGAHSGSPDLTDMVSLVGSCRAIRRIGSAALNLAYVASGRLDLHWAREICPWDVAAGALLVREAGGLVTHPNGGGFDLWDASILAAATGGLHAQMVDVLAGK